MYQALYRKWRPRTFDDVVGQEHVTETLKNQIATSRTSHAYLFIGTRGTGKTTCAKVLARAINCENPQNGNPCNKCKSCLGIEDGSIMDVVEMDAASNNGVDNVRALRDEAVFSPVSVKKRVYIVDEVHMLSGAAFNALLKILEEPPEHLVFILATTELHKVPATILSRCQRHSFRRIDPEVMAKQIGYVAEQEGMELENDAASLLARLADGSLRDGLSLLDQCSASRSITVSSVLDSMGLAGNLRISQLLSEITLGDTQKALLIFSELYKNGKAPVTVLTELCALLRDILMTKEAPGAVDLLSGSFAPKTLSTFEKTLSGEEIISHMDSVQTAIGSLKSGRDPKIAAELCIIGMCEPDLGESLGTLRMRVSRLEKRLESPVNSCQTVQQDFVQLEEVTTRSGDIEHQEKDEDIDEPPFDLTDNIINEEKISQRDNILNYLTEENRDFQYETVQTESQKNASSKSASISTDVGQAKAPSEDGEIWTRVKARLKATMPVFLYVNLSDAQGEIKDGSLTIFAVSAFKKTQLETTQAGEFIRSALIEENGEPMPFKVVEGGGPSSGNCGGNKLQELNKFGNVKFE